MNISVVNHTGGGIPDQEVQRAIRAVNRQIAEDFAPYWGMTATLRLEGRTAQAPDSASPADLRGDAVIYLWDQVNLKQALGYHSQNAQGIPHGFVFTKISDQIREDWTVTLSHEALELIVDPETNMLVMGPHPTEERDVFYWYEVCDAVQKESYQIDGIAVSNFLLPLYFTGTRKTDEVGARNDFLGEARGNTSPPLTSFGLRDGGYVGFFDPKLQDNRIFTLARDREAAERYLFKAQAKEARRAIRYRDPEARQRLLQSTSTEHQPPRVSKLRPDQIQFLPGPGPDQPSGNGHHGNGQKPPFVSLRVPIEWIDSQNP
jgi:hypothetical protein